MRKTIGKVDITQSIKWAINTSSGFIYVSKGGEWWFGGSPSLVHLALFPSRKFAMKAVRKIRRHRPEMIEWTQTVAVWTVQESRKNP